jgi:hypothetical protein
MKKIVYKSFELYFKRKGHAQLPDGMISQEEIERQKNDELLRVRMFWKYWHGSQTLSVGIRLKVSTVVDSFL